MQCKEDEAYIFTHTHEGKASLNICCWTASPHLVLLDHKEHLELFPIVYWYGDPPNEHGVQLNCAVFGGQFLG